MMQSFKPYDHEFPSLSAAANIPTSRTKQPIRKAWQSNPQVEQPEQQKNEPGPQTAQPSAQAEQRAAAWEHQSLTIEQRIPTRDQRTAPIEQQNPANEQQTAAVRPRIAPIEERIPYIEAQSAAIGQRLPETAQPTQQTAQPTQQTEQISTHIEEPYQTVRLRRLFNIKFLSNDPEERSWEDFLCGFRFGKYGVDDPLPSRFEFESLDQGRSVPKYAFESRIPAPRIQTNVHPRYAPGCEQPWTQFQRQQLESMQRMLGLL